jgi:SAM-dependent methyltransferase
VVATDLNPPMLQRAAAVGTARPVHWLPADATRLPFDDARFDVVVCQFGVMFFPDKVRAFAEARRVLRRGGTLLFNVWDRIEDNEFADVVTQALATRYPADPPRFMARTPHGHGDPAALRADLAAAGFAAPRIETLAARSRAPSAREAAIAYCQGTPLRTEIEARDPTGLAAATETCVAALVARFATARWTGATRRWCSRRGLRAPPARPNVAVMAMCRHVTCQKLQLDAHPGCRNAGTLRALSCRNEPPKPFLAVSAAPTSRPTRRWSSRSRGASVRACRPTSASTNWSRPGCWACTRR